MSLIDLELEVLRFLHKLPKNDRDLKTLIVSCNPNFVRGSDKEIEPKIIEILNRLKKDGKISQKKKKLRIISDKPKKEFVLYNLI